MTIVKAEQFGSIETARRDTNISSLAAPHPPAPLPGAPGRGEQRFGVALWAAKTENSKIFHN